MAFGFVRWIAKPVRYAERKEVDVLPRYSLGPVERNALRDRYAR
jgi:hypothetical protein